ncbi:MAG: pilin, partial [Patescibacteria group bacterium]
LGERVLTDASGIGRSTLVATAPVKYRDATVSLVVTTQDSSVVAQATTEIAPRDPLVRMYPYDPLLGPNYDSALGSEYTLNATEGTLRAVPYFFSAIPSIEWGVGGVAQGAQRDLTVRATGSGSGTSALEVKARIVGTPNIATTAPCFVLGRVRHHLVSLASNPMRTWLLLTSVLLLTPLMVFAQDNTSTAFVPLTSIPGIESAGNAQSLPDFLNNLYRLAIGAAAVLAVLQIVRAGIMYMGGDSVTEKKEAKSLIALSVGGLILILSPVVVFSIINPDILSLKINKLGELADTTFEAYQRGQEIGGRTETLLWTNSVLSRSAAEAKCKTDGGTHLEYVCKKPDGTTRTLSVSQSCVAGEEGLGFCYKTGVRGGGADSEMQKMCELYHRRIAPEGASCARLLDDEWSKMDNACCGGLTAGNQCCGKLKTSPNEPPPAI